MQGSKNGTLLRPRRYPGAGAFFGIASAGIPTPATLRPRQGKQRAAAVLSADEASCFADDSIGCCIWPVDPGPEQSHRIKIEAPSPKTPDANSPDLQLRACACACRFPNAENQMTRHNAKRRRSPAAAPLQLPNRHANQVSQVARPARCDGALLPSSLHRAQTAKSSILAPLDSLATSQFGLRPRPVQVSERFSGLANLTALPPTAPRPRPARATG